MAARTQRRAACELRDAQTAITSALKAAQAETMLREQLRSMRADLRQ